MYTVFCMIGGDLSIAAWCDTEDGATEEKERLVTKLGEQAKVWVRRCPDLRLAFSVFRKHRADVVPEESARR